MPQALAKFLQIVFEPPELALLMLSQFHLLADCLQLVLSDMSAFSFALLPDLEVVIGVFAHLLFDLGSADGIG